MNAQALRCVQAAGLLALIVPIGSLVTSLSHQEKDVALPESSREIPRVANSEESLFEDETLFPLDLFWQITEGNSVDRGVSKEFEHEVVALPDECLDARSSKGVVGYVTPLDTHAVLQRFTAELKEKGWQEVADAALSASQKNAVLQASFFKHEGQYRWLYLTLYDMGDATTCVFVFDEEGSA